MQTTASDITPGNNELENNCFEMNHGNPIFLIVVFNPPTSHPAKNCKGIYEFNLGDSH